MRRILPLLIASSIFSAAAHADDLPGWYVGATASLSFIDKYEITTPQDPSYKAIASTKEGPRFGANIGYHWNNYLRTEVEAFVESNKTQRASIAGIPVDTTSTVTVAYMGNIYLDIANSSRFTPYVGGGAGIMHLRPPFVWTINEKKLEDWVPAYQLMAGVSYRAFLNSDIYLGYRFVSTMNDGKDRQSGTEAVFPYQSHSADLGFRYSF